MKTRILIFAAILAVLAALVWWAGPGPGRGGARTALQPPSPNRQSEGAPAAETGQLPTVKGIVLAVQDETGREFNPLTLKAGEKQPLPGTPYAVRFTEFYTHWSWDSRAMNLSYAEQNPAVKVEVFRDGDFQYYGWGFKNIPFFRMGHHAPALEGTGQPERLAFSLLNYEGLKLPKGS
jgi:hypothetical protein